ncbi:MAG: hypothetical protein R2862_00450 [Thermoanaerobaculia bacterium]
MIVERIRSFVERPDEAEFEPLALAAIAYQFDRIAPYRAMCERAGRTPQTVSAWRDVPVIPATAFASVELATDEPRETFRSSGTLDDARSVHRHPFPELYRAVVDATFPAAVLPAGSAAPMLSLVPPRDVVGDSSLGFMVDHVVSRFGAPGTIYACGPRGVEGGKARSWLNAHQRAGRPVVLLATSYALADLLDFIGRIDLKFRLPPGSVVMETGGFKARDREISPAELHDRLLHQLGIPADAVVAEYGMTELTSQAYTRTLDAGDPELFVLPPWMRVRALDPVTLGELPAGEKGLLTVFDLANVGSALHLLTEDLGSTEPGGFRLAGRAPDAARRGCSLLAEELAARGR